MDITESALCNWSKMLGLCSKYVSVKCIHNVDINSA